MGQCQLPDLSRGLEIDPWRIGSNKKADWGQHSFMSLQVHYQIVLNGTGSLSAVTVCIDLVCIPYKLSWFS